jgi:hypothetical protein
VDSAFKHARNVVLAALLLASCGEDDDKDQPREGWQVGPVIDGRNHSKGTGIVPNADGSFSIAINPTAEPHYVTRRHGPLTGKQEIRLRYRVQGEAIYNPPFCNLGTVTIHLQREGDDWQADGYRWWATFATRALASGEYEIVAPLNGRWTSIYTANSETHAGLFARALAETERVGFTFGNCDGYGHGANASAPVEFTALSFEVL